MKPLDDQWTSIDYPVLREVVRRVTNPTIPSTLHSHIADELSDSLTKEQVDLALTRLAKYGYIDGIGSGQRLIPRISGVNERALRATGVWPSDDFSSASDDLARFIDKQAEHAPPEEQKWWQRIRDTFADAGQDVTAKVIAEIVARQAGL